jgi:signal recognition particle subunit SEC65
VRRKRIRIIILVLLFIFLAIQAYRPARNHGELHGPQSLAVAHPIPANVEAILQKACYDCHSNSTRYPWYTNIQPGGWWMQHHVNEGKESLNFSEWTSYSPEDMPHVLEELQEEVREGHMPLPSYLWLHGEAKLTAVEKDALLSWARSLEIKLRGRQTGE